MYTRIRIRKGQRGLRFRGGDFAEMLRPGRYWLRVDRYDASSVRLVSEDVDSILVAGARTGLVSEVRSEAWSQATQPATADQGRPS